MDYMKICQEALDALEEHLRAFVREKLAENFGENWQKTNVPPGILEDWRKKLNKEKSRRFPILPVSEAIDYSDLGQLKDIICRRDNFERVFKPFFGNRDAIGSKIEELIAFRNPAAHNRNILGSEQYETVIVISRSIFDAMCIARPILFNSLLSDSDGEDHVGDEPLGWADSGPVKGPSCHHNLPRPDCPTFFGREHERERIMEYLGHARSWITTIDGIGGVGKTALALNCAEHVRDASLSGESDFEYIIWASAKTERLTPSGIDKIQPVFADLESLVATILEVAGFQGFEAEDKVSLVKEILEISKTLLVLDNLETVSDPELDGFLRDVPSPSKVLATTRNRIEISQNNLRLTALPNQDGLDMIRQLANDLDAQELTQAGDVALTGLIDRVGGIPLAIRLAVGRIATGLPLSSYINRLDTGAAQHDLLEFCFSESWDSLNDESKLTLLATILFAEPPSEVELRLVTEIPEVRLNDAIEVLTRRAFLNSTYDRAGETHRYSLLPLTSDFVRQKSEQDPELKAELQDKYNSYLLQAGRFAEALGQITHLVPESHSITEAERLSNMLVESGFRAYQGGNYSEAVRRLETAKSYRETAYLNHTWGVIERDEEHFGTARARFRESIKMDETRLPTWRSWGKMERQLGNWKRAVECFSNASQLPGADPQDFHGLGVCLSRSATEAIGSDRHDLLSQAETALRKGFYRNPLGYRETHHNVINCHSLALTLQRLGRTNEALIQCRNGLRLEPYNERLINLNLSLRK